MKKLMAIPIVLVLLLVALPVSTAQAAGGIWQGFNVWIGEGSTEIVPVTLSDGADLEIDWYDLGPGDGDSLTILVEGHEISGSAEYGDTAYISLPPGLYDIGFRCDYGGGNSVIPIDYIITEMPFTGDYIHLDLFQYVAVDIAPQSCPNPLNISGKGVLPVAILGSESFDVTQIDPSTVRLECVAPLRWAYEDIATPYEPNCMAGCEACHETGPDGYLDLTLKFKTQEIVDALDTVSDGDCRWLFLMGSLKLEFGGGPFWGEDVVLILAK